jgi:hypothetical protein
MSTLTRLLVRAHPSAWRARYASELEQLVEDVGASPSVLADLTVSLVRAWIQALDAEPHVRTIRGDIMNVVVTEPRHGALLGLAVALPTTMLVLVAVLKYVFGIAGPFDLIEPAMTPIVTHPLGETIFVLSPYLGLLFALVPVTRVSLDRQQDGVRIAIRLVAPVANLLAAAMCAAVVVFMALYWVAENLAALAVLSACLSGGPGWGCSSEEARALEVIDHYGDRSVAAEDVNGLCRATFSEDDPPAAVMDHYRAALLREGWQIEQDDGMALFAHRNGVLQLTINASPLGDDGGASYEVLLGEAQPGVGD